MKIDIYSSKQKIKRQYRSSFISDHPTCKYRMNKPKDRIAGWIKTNLTIYVAYRRLIIALKTNTGSK